MRRHIQTIKEKYKKLKRWQRITSIIIIILVVVLITVFNQKPKSSSSILDDNYNKEVILKSVADLSLDKEPLELIGTVQSESQVDIRTESSGTITSVSTKINNKISAGQVIAEIENSTQRANVSQAEALVRSQEAQLKSLKESITDSGDTVAVKNARRTLYSTGLVAEPYEETSTLTPPIISGTYNGNEEGEYNIYIDRGDQYGDYTFYLKGLEVIRETEIVKNENIPTNLGTRGLKISFTGNVADYLNTRWIVKIPNTESSYYSTNLSVYNSALDGERQMDDQITAQEAQVQSAKSSLNAARAQLEKTIIRSPISGTVNSLDIDLGDFVSAFQPVAMVANENRLEIKTYITEKDKNSIQVGSPVVVAGKYSGVITSVSPAVDSLTKKIEVSVSVDEQAKLINGQSVSVSIDRKDTYDQEFSQIYIPLSALKVTAEGVVVFKVDDGGIVSKHLVKEGPLVGSKVLILEGLTPEMKIITDVRGISVGDVVTVVN